MAKAESALRHLPLVDLLVDTKTELVGRRWAHLHGAGGYSCSTRACAASRPSNRTRNDYVELTDLKALSEHDARADRLQQEHVGEHVAYCGDRFEPCAVHRRNNLWL